MLIVMYGQAELTVRSATSVLESAASDGFAGSGVFHGLLSLNGRHARGLSDPASPVVPPVPPFVPPPAPPAPELVELAVVPVEEVASLAPVASAAAPSVGTTADPFMSLIIPSPHPNERPIKMPNE